MNFFRSARGVVLALGVAFCLMGATSPSLAEHRVGPRAEIAPNRFTGKVISVSGPSASPYALSLQVRSGRIIDFSISPRAAIAARSAEAEVEGCMVNDFALVLAHKVNKAWIADSITYDVSPIKPVQIMVVTGQVVKWNFDSSRFEVRIDPVTIRWVRMDPTTRVRLDNQPATPSAIVKGVAVTVFLEKIDGQWTAEEVDIHSPGHQSAG